MDFEAIIHTVGTVVDVTGVAVIVLGALLVTGLFCYRLLHGRPFPTTYQLYRQGLGRAILLGLEFLVAGDIIRTVAIT
ncbi:MAG TPA: DUF1622 domain-containing protein, partial [Cryptosporangiaceae bacterium]|nr:DUF1622 domain-containing protein [Cryptosporangiaceae bacterium]